MNDEIDKTKGTIIAGIIVGGIVGGGFGIVGMVVGSILCAMFFVTVEEMIKKEGEVID